MVWKILSALTIICLGTASYFAWANQQDFKNEKVRAKNAEANLKAAQTRKAELEADLKEKQAQLATIEKDRDTLKDEASKFTIDAKEKEDALALIKGNLEQVSTQVDSVEKQIADAGDIEKLVAQVEKLKADQADAEAALANAIQNAANSKDQVEAITKQIVALRDAEARGRRGIVDTEFNARISQYFPEWDFAILNKGNNGGVFANADLEVKRGVNVIAKLKVRNVEQNRAIADLVPGTLTSGNFIQAGDVVVAAANQSAAKPDPVPPSDTKATPTADGAPAAPAPGAAPAMGSDPFGAPAAPAPGAAPAMGSDPFGAPAAPAPGAAPAMGSDPFGAPAAPAPGAAPAMGSDPFGAPAAPAPAPGTAAPSTADPFATAPAKP